jgi:deoxyribonuclease V
MTIDTISPWTYDLEKAVQVQENLRQHLLLSWDGRPLNTLAGIDVSYTQDSIRAAVAVLRYPSLTSLRTVTGEAPQGFPYVAGLLAFREGPAILAAWERLKLKPDLLLIHGHGTAHPRGVGLASHIGYWLNLPTIGIAKTRLYGTHTEVGPRVGDWSELVDEKEPGHVIGAVLRTCENTKPIYVSPGHLIDLEHSIEFVLECSRGCRMPEPLRAAHQAAAKPSQLHHKLLTEA